MSKKFASLVTLQNSLENCNKAKFWGSISVTWFGTMCRPPPNLHRATLNITACAILERTVVSKKALEAISASSAWV